MIEIITCLHTGGWISMAKGIGRITYIKSGRNRLDNGYGAERGVLRTGKYISRDAPSPKLMNSISGKLGETVMPFC